jgi:hypothetical protein
MVNSIHSKMANANYFRLDCIKYYSKKKKNYYEPDQKKIKSNVPIHINLENWNKYKYRFYAQILKRYKGQGYTEILIITFEIRKIKNLPEHNVLPWLNRDYKYLRRRHIEFLEKKLRLLNKKGLGNTHI